jgi:hypothetical protein
MQENCFQERGMAKQHGGLNIEKNKKDPLSFNAENDFQ